DPARLTRRDPAAHGRDRASRRSDADGMARRRRRRDAARTCPLRRARGSQASARRPPLRKDAQPRARPEGGAVMLEVLFGVSLLLVAFAYFGYPLVMWLRARTHALPIAARDWEPSV